jgi:hypothetical protein
VVKLTRSVRRVSGFVQVAYRLPIAKSAASPRASEPQRIAMTHTIAPIDKWTSHNFSHSASVN